MQRRFGLHQIWFCYTDERNAPYVLDGCVSPCKEIYNNEDDAIKEAIRLDIEIIREFTFKGLLWMYELDVLMFKDLISGYYASGWEEHLLPTEIDFPLKHLSDQQLASIREKNQIAFHQVIEHKTSNRAYFIKISEEFWDKEVLAYLKSKRYISDSRDARIFEPKEFEEHSKNVPDLWIKSNGTSGLFLFNRTTGKAIISSEEEAQRKMAYMLIDLFRLFPSKNILYREGIESVTQYPKLCKLTIDQSSKLQKVVDYIRKEKPSLANSNIDLKTEKLTHKEITIIQNFV